MSYMLSGCQVILTLILLIAAIGKLAYPQSFINALRISGLRPNFLVTGATLIVGWEFACAVMLLFHTSWLLPVAFLATALLLTIFIAWMVWVYLRKIHVQCGCFGAGSSNVNFGGVVRNVILIGVSALGWILSRSTTSLLPPASLWVLALSLTLVVIVCYVRFQYLPHLGLGRQKNA